MGTVLQDLRPLPVPVEIHAETASRVAAEQFYAAQDVALRTGDPYLLIASVDPAFVDHRPSQTVPLDRIGFVEEVIALQGTVPDLRVVAEPLLVDDDRVLVYVSRHPTDSAVSVSRMAAFEHIIGDTLEGGPRGGWQHRRALELRASSCDRSILPGGAGLGFARISVGYQYYRRRAGMPRLGLSLIFLKMAGTKPSALASKILVALDTGITALLASALRSRLQPHPTGSLRKEWVG